MPRYRKRRGYRKNRAVRRAVKKVYRKKFVRRVKSATETKIIKDIQDNSTHFTILNSKANVICPYFRLDSSVTDGDHLTHWINNATSPAQLRNFIEVGPNYNQRIGRKVTISKSSWEMICFLNNPDTSANKEFPLFVNLRIIQGWVKGGYSHLKDLMIDGDTVAGYTMYSELPYTKYRIMKDYTITRYPMAPISAPASGQDVVAAYKPIKLKFNWRGQPINFQDSVVDEPDRGWAGWCPFAIVFNPQADNGVQGLTSALNLRVDYCKRVISYKDA